MLPHDRIVLLDDVREIGRAYLNQLQLVRSVHRILSCGIEEATVRIMSEWTYPVPALLKSLMLTPTV